MVQVDVFWAYGLGGSLAAAAGPRLLKRTKPFESNYFVSSILFLALVWAPTGMLLLLWHPSWETMQVAKSLSSMNAFLILAFGLTNITQGILGFYIGYLLLRSRRFYLAQLNWIFGYFGMFFILVYGWDGLGFDRFFYDRDMLPGSPQWTPGAGTEGTIPGLLSAIWKFLQSGVFWTLMIDAVYLIPTLGIFLMAWWYLNLRDNDAAAGEHPTLMQSAIKILDLQVRYLLGVFIVGLGGAIFCAFVVHYLGVPLGVGDNIQRALGEIPTTTGRHIVRYIIGLPLALGILWFLLLKPGRLVSKFLAPLSVTPKEN